MTARLSPLQRQVLEQLAHIRVAPEDAWMSTERLATLTGRTPNRTDDTLWHLRERRLVNSSSGRSGVLWRITDKGRQALG